jgi:5-methylcytosine-specific restriction endonuclease McrA
VTEMSKSILQTRRPKATLVLNADCQPAGLVPLRTVDWQVAIKNIFEGKATVVEEYDDWIVRSPSMQMNVPSVIINREYIKPRYSITFTRENLFVRDDYTCQYCHGVFEYENLTFDHVVPHSMGGPQVWTNIVAACYPCNGRKGNNAKIIPKRMPYRPSYWEMAEKVKNYPVWVRDESWNNYIGWDPDLVEVLPRRILTKH